MPTIRTLHDIDDGHHRVWAHCKACGHSSELHLAALIVRLGADFELAELRLRVVCSRCRAVAPDVVVYCNHDGRPG